MSDDPYYQPAATRSMSAAEWREWAAFCDRQERASRPAPVDAEPVIERLPEAA